MATKRHTLFQLRILAVILTVHLTSAVDFLFNGFDASSDVSLYGTAAVESNTLSLTPRSYFSIGRALYSSRIPTRQPNSSMALPFSTSFIFSMAPYEGFLFPGHGLVFLFVPHTGIEGSSSAQHLGFLNFTNNGDPDNHVMGVEFDCFMNQEFNDINANHVGVDVNSLVSVSAHEAGYYPDADEDSFEVLDLNNGRNYQVWIDYVDSTFNVAMAAVGSRRPDRPLLSVTLNLSEVLEDEMYVGFTASTGDMVQSHRILGWSFSNTNISLSEGLITEGLPSFILRDNPIYRTRAFITGFIVGTVIFAIVCFIAAYVFVKRSQRRKRKKKDEFEDWELEYWPHRINYQEIDSATKGFTEENVIGIGGNGKVYRGILPRGSEIAIKRISHGNDEGTRAFLAEISSLGRMKHRNLVTLRGWCKKDKSNLFLVYDYMENGSLDKWVFEPPGDEKVMSYEDRIRILTQVASGILYLHEGWEATVLHRDIKASNVLLDGDMNARLGDFGLARMHDHDRAAGITRVVGTAGYLAPEVTKNGRASTKTDVFSYGILILEVVCGRRPVGEGQPPLADWVWEVLKQGEVVRAVDPRLRARGDVADGEGVEKVIHLGLLCTHMDPNARPTMRQVVSFFEGKGEHDLLERLGDLRDGSAGSHPMFSEFSWGNSSSMSMYWSNTMVDGR